MLSRTLFAFTLAAIGASSLEAQRKPSTTDPRARLRGGVADAQEAASNLALVAHRPRPDGFFNAGDVGDFAYANSDLAFAGTYAFIGGYHGVQVWDITTPASPALRATLPCPGGQGDVSVLGRLLFMSVEENKGRVDCGRQGVSGNVSPERFRGVRIFDISDIDHPRQVAAVQTCRGSHTHTLVPDAKDAGRGVRVRLRHRRRAPVGRTRRLH